MNIDVDSWPTYIIVFRQLIIVTWPTRWIGVTYSNDIMAGLRRHQISQASHERSIFFFRRRRLHCVSYR